MRLVFPWLSDDLPSLSFTGFNIPERKSAITAKGFTTISFTALKKSAINSSTDFTILILEPPPEGLSAGRAFCTVSTVVDAPLLMVSVNVLADPAAFSVTLYIAGMGFGPDVIVKDGILDFF